MTEAELQEKVIRLAGQLGLRVFHSGVPWHDVGRGLPDLIIVGRRVLWAELKSAGGRLSPQQREWQRDLVAAGQSWRLWRPAHLASGQVESELRELAGPGAGVIPAGSP